MAVYPGGLSEVKTTVAWKDAIARFALASGDNDGEWFDVSNPPAMVEQQSTQVNRITTSTRRHTLSAKNQQSEGANNGLRKALPQIREAARRTKSFHQLT